MPFNQENKTMHIVMYPWLALSHLTSFLRLSNKLAQKGHKISFFVPTKTQLKLSPHNHHPHLITFIPVTVPPVQGLPAEAETTNDVPASAIPHLMASLDLTKDMLDSQLAHLNPDFVFFDFAMWVPELAKKHGAKSLYYATSSLIRFAYVGFKSREMGLDQDITDGELMSSPSEFPTPAMALGSGEAKALSLALRAEAGGVSFFKRLRIAFQECDALGSKTCREMEGPYFEFLQKEQRKPVLLAGPMVPKPPTGKLDEKFDGWLKGFGKGSVVYCALGSECVLNLELFQELVLGLELTGMPFLAALKKPIECETMESALPEGFLKRTKGRGIVHDGWVQQPLILQHSSVGCFVTHCGAGSLSEAILSECQLVLLPQAVDQFINAKFMSMDLKVGVEVDRRENDCFFYKEVVSKTICKVMEVGSEVGKEVKTNHAKWKQLLLKDGLEDSYINEFIRNLQDLLG